MKNEINVKKIVDDAMVQSSEKEIRLNHTDCPAGEDVRRRLYIKFLDHPEGAILGHCFNCGGSGAYFPKNVKYKTLTDLLTPHGEEYSSTHSRLPPERICKAANEISDLRIKAWLYKFYTDEADWSALKLQQLDKNGTYLIIPANKDVIQLRGFGGTFLEAKYINSVTTENAPLLYSSICTGTHNSVVITEDILSAYRIYRDLKVDSFALLGTKLRPQLLDFLRDGQYKEVFIWLDGDNPGRQASLDVCRQLVPHLHPSSHCQIIINQKSPKQLSPEELIQVAAQYFMK